MDPQVGWAGNGRRLVRGPELTDEQTAKQQQNQQRGRRLDGVFHGPDTSRDWKRLDWWTQMMICSGLGNAPWWSAAEMAAYHCIVQQPLASLLFSSGAAAPAAESSNAIQPPIDRGVADPIDDLLGQAS